MPLNEDSIEQGFNFSFHWFFIPPLPAVMTVFVAGLLGSGRRVSVDAALWGLALLLFIILTLFYGVLIRQELYGGLIPVQLIAQGILLCPLSLHFGAEMLQWVGVVLAVSGAILLFALYCTRSRPAAVPPSVVLNRPTAPEIDFLPFPVAVTDDEGNLISVSDSLLSIFGKPRSAAEGRKITVFFPPEREAISLGNREWKITQSSFRNGSCHCFCLEEIRTVPAFGATPFIDSDTGLCTRPYAARRVVEEIYRIRRYRRWMSAVLLRMVFSYPLGMESKPSTENAIFDGYCHFVRAGTREADIPCRTGTRDIVVVMPETLQDAGRDVAGKLSDFKSWLQELPHLQEIFNSFEGTVGVRSGVAFFDASSGRPDFEEFLRVLETAMKEGVSS